MATTEAPQKATGKPATSRLSKRKADEPPPEESESDDGFDAMDIDKKDVTATLDEGSTTDERQDTPQPLEDETASEIDDEAPPRPPTSKKGGRAQTISRTTKAAVTQDVKRPRNAPELSAKPEISEPPPPRELPFSKKRAAEKPVIESNEGDATDSGDDEL